MNTSGLLFAVLCPVCLKVTVKLWFLLSPAWLWSSPALSTKRGGDDATAGNSQSRSRSFALRTADGCLATRRPIRGALLIVRTVQYRHQLNTPSVCAALCCWRWRGGGGCWCKGSVGLMEWGQSESAEVHCRCSTVLLLERWQFYFPFYFIDNCI